MATDLGNPLLSPAPLPRLLARSAWALFVVLSLAALVAASFTTEALTSWVGFLFMAATPPQIMLAMIWQCSWPARLARLPQPAKGLALVAVDMLFATPAAVFLMILSGNGFATPTPFLLMMTLAPIPIMLVLVPVWHCWPVSLFARRPFALGVGTLLFNYILSYALFRLLFDFSFLSEAPFYRAAMDPHGLLSAFTALSMIVTTSAIVLVLQMLDFWPFNLLMPAARQPLFGIVTTLFALLVAMALFAGSTRGLGWAPVQHLVRVAASLIFGIFIVETTTAHELLFAWPQPRRGLAKFLMASIAGYVGYNVYAAVAPWFAGVPIDNVAPKYSLDLWIANALLGFTFPLMIVVTKYFEFWPFAAPTTRPH